MLEFVVKILFIIMTVCAYLMAGIKIAGMFDELENDRYIFLWPVVLWWLFLLLTEDTSWRRWLRRMRCRIEEPFYVDEE